MGYFDTNDHFIEMDDEIGTNTTITTKNASHEKTEKAASGNYTTRRETAHRLVSMHRRLD